jgi:hypothetical protein
MNTLKAEFRSAHIAGKDCPGREYFSMDGHRWMVRGRFAPMLRSPIAERAFSSQIPPGSTGKSL